VVVLIVGAFAFTFVVHALSVAPTNGVLVLNPVASSPRYLQSAATSAPGEVVALIALIVSGLGLVLSLATD
jgi:ABC-type branched-subunit amino acid transport system substrate-binding protein